MCLCLMLRIEPNSIYVSVCAALGSFSLSTFKYCAYVSLAYVADRGWMDINVGHLFGSVAGFSNDAGGGGDLLTAFSEFLVK